MDLQNNNLIDMYERLFAEEGWKELVSDFKERRDGIKDRLLFGSNVSEKELHLAQGMAHVWSYVIDLEKIIERAKKINMESHDGAIQ